MRVASVARQCKSVQQARERATRCDIEQVRDDPLQGQWQLHREKSCALMVVLTGVPTAGRSEAVNELVGWLDPEHVSVYAPDPDDPAAADRPYMWRWCARARPDRHPVRR